MLLGGDAQGEAPIEMYFSAGDSLGMAKDILDIHRRAWGGNGPIDAKEGERRPIWIWAYVRTGERGCDFESFTADSVRLTDYRSVTTRVTDAST